MLLGLDCSFGAGALCKYVSRQARVCGTKICDSTIGDYNFRERSVNGKHIDVNIAELSFTANSKLLFQSLNFGVAM